MFPPTPSLGRYASAPPRYVRLLLDALTPRRFPFACLTLIAVNLLVFSIARMCGDVESYVTLKRMGAGLSPAALGPEPWRLLSAGYLHLGWRHLLVNLTSLLLCGMYLEGLLGPWRLLLLYTLSILVSNTLMMGFYPEVLAMGASGGICGLWGAMLVLCFRPGRQVWWWHWRYRLAPAASSMGLVVSTIKEADETRGEFERLWVRPMTSRLYTRPVVYSASYWKELYWIQRWVMLRGEWRIELVTVRAPGMPENWEEVENDVALSLVVREPGAPRWDTYGAWNTIGGGVCPRGP